MDEQAPLLGQFRASRAPCKADHEPSDRFLHALRPVEERLGYGMRGRVFLEYHPALLKSVEKLQRVVPVLQNEGDGEDVPDVIRLSLHVLPQLGDHALRALQSGPDLCDIDLDSVPAVENQAALRLIIGNRFPQTVKKQGYLDKGPSGGFCPGDMRRMLPVVMVEIVEALAPRLQKEPQLGIIIDILAVLLDGLDKMAHLEERTGGLLPRRRHVQGPALIAGKGMGIFPGGGEKKEVAGVLVNDATEVRVPQDRCRLPHGPQTVQVETGVGRSQRSEPLKL